MSASLKMAVAVACLSMTLCAALPGPAAADSSERVHVVVKGDTLWDISSTYLYDPFVWPQIWNVNRDIENPHLIYPGQKILIPALMARVSAPTQPEPEPSRPELPPPPMAPEPEVAAAEPPPAPAPMTPQEKQEMITALSTYGFIIDQDRVGMATITGTEKERLLISPNMRVYLKAGKGQTLEADQKYSITRVFTEVRHPVTGKKVGYLAKILGDLTVQEVKPDMATAMVEEVYRPVEIGDNVIRHIDYLRSLPVEASTPSDLAGYILINPEGKTIMGRGDVLFLDLGTSQGLRTGDVMTILEKGAAASEAVGEVQVVVPLEKTSVARITKSSREILPGEKVTGSPR